MPCVEGAERYDYDECEAGIGSSFTKGKVVNFFHHRGHGGTQRKISRPLGYTEENLQASGYTEENLQAPWRSCGESFPKVEPKNHLLRSRSQRGTEDL